MRKLYYINMPERRLSESASGGAISRIAPWVLGEKMVAGFRFLEGGAAGLEVVDPDASTLWVAAGRVERRPESGQFALQVGAGASTGANTTGPMDGWRVSAEELVGKLNALSGGPGDFAGLDVPGGVEVWRAGGQAVSFTVRGNTLLPRAIVRVEPSQDGAGRWRYEVRPTVAPLAFADGAARVLPEAPVVARVQAGGSDPSNTTFWNEIQSLRLPADFAGTYQLRRGYGKTDPLSTADDETAIQDALNAILAAEGGRCRVTLVDDGLLHIEFLGELAGAALDLLGVVVYSAPPGDWTIELDLNTPELEAATRAGDVTVLFEGGMVVPIEPGNPAAGTRRRHLFTETVTVTRPVAWEGLATSQNIDWLRPRARDYVPFTEDQLLVGQQQAYTAVVGNGSATEFDLDHNLASELAYVVVRENEAGGRRIGEDEYRVVFVSADTVRLDFAAGPNPYGAPGIGALAVQVVAVGPESAFQQHENTVPQIVAGGGYPSLPDFMDDIGSRVQALEAVLPTTGPGAAVTQASGIEIELPDVREVLLYRGTAAAFDEKGGVNAAVLGRAPLLLPAVHDGTLASYTGGALPAAAAGTVWTNDSGAGIDLGRGRGGVVPAGGHFGSDGRVLYRVVRDGTTNSYYPAVFERELWRIFINEKMLRIGRVLDVQFAVVLQLVNATSNAQWMLVIEHGTAPSQGTPSPTGTNLENVLWNATPLLSQRLIVTPARQRHAAGARVKRSLVAGVDTLTSDEMLYGVWASATGPSGANFALRARLVRFDTENAVEASARGWCVVEVEPPTLDGEASAKAKATIS